MEIKFSHVTETNVVVDRCRHRIFDYFSYTNFHIQIFIYKFSVTIATVKIQSI